ncbi:hypothetical protein, partial [Alistipes putredinis]|uniref:hypothetical protein n=2 Tax=Alistipes putredinis TaxID=28117 RepID=UPI003A938B3B
NLCFVRILFREFVGGNIVAGKRGHLSCPTGYGDRRFVIQKLPLRAEIRRGNSMILPDALI